MKIDLTPEELSRTLWSLDDYQLSSNDTLSEETFKKMKTFWKNQKTKVFTLGTSSAVYAFQGYDIGYNFGKYENSPAWKQYEYLCHYYWTSGAHPEYTTGLINLFPNNCRPEINYQFWKYLLSPTESPYRDVLKDIYVIRSQGKDTKGFPMGILWPDVKTTNALLLTHLLITSRLLTGWSLDIVFHRLLEAGFSKPVAMILSVLFEFNHQTVTGQESFGDHFLEKTVSDTLSWAGPHPSDQPFGRGEGKDRWTNFSPKRFATGNYQKLPDDTLPGGTKLTQTNHLWFNDNPILTGALSYSEDEDSYCCEDCDGDYAEWRKAQREKNELTDAWGLVEIVEGKTPDPGVVAEIEKRMQNDIPLNFSKKD